MANDSPQLVRFVNDEIRPLCEAARALKARIAVATTEWYGGVNALTTNDSNLLVDGREAEGLFPLTGADVTNAIGNLISVASGVNDEIIQKPCVNPLRVS